jgi:hypothetical protein
MQELRLVAVSEDGSYAVLTVPGRSGRFALPIDERLRTVARGQFSRLAQYEIEVESPLRPKEIQDRIRAGETAEEIADAAGLPVDRIRRFEGPVLAEREFKATEAQRATVRSRTESGPGPRLGEVVEQRLADAGASVEEVEWDSRKRHDGNWQIQLAYTVAGRMFLAEWVYDPRSKHVTPDDDEAIRLCLSESEWPEPRPMAKSPVTATVTPIGSRAAASHQPDGRADTDRAGGRGLAHPSRQVSAPVVAAAGGGHKQAPGGGRPAESAEGAQVVPARSPALPSGPESPAARVAREGSPAAGRQGAAAASERVERESAAGIEAAAGRAAAVGRDISAGPSDPGAARAPAAAADQREREDQAPTEPADAAPPARPARRASGGRSRRSSVPSWDEIMFGNSRQPD